MAVKNGKGTGMERRDFLKAAAAVAATGAITPASLAGAEPTASAVVADVVDVVRTLTTDPGNRVPHLAFQPNAISDLPILPVAEVESAYYLRMQAVNRPGVLADVTRILGDLDISIEAILQKGSGEQESVLPVILLTQTTVEHRIDDALRQLAALPTIENDISRIRVEALD